VVLCSQSEQPPSIPFSFEPRVYCRVQPVYCVGLFSTYSRVTDLLPLFHLAKTRVLLPYVHSRVSPSLVAVSFEIAKYK